MERSKNKLGSRPGEQLKSTLSVLNAFDTKEVDQKVKPIHEEVAK
jgi:hypothetical protein